MHSFKISASENEIFLNKPISNWGTPSVVRRQPLAEWEPSIKDAPMPRLN